MRRRADGRGSARGAALAPGAGDRSSARGGVAARRARRSRQAVEADPLRRRVHLAGGCAGAGNRRAGGRASGARALPARPVVAYHWCLATPASGSLAQIPPVTITLERFQLDLMCLATLSMRSALRRKLKRELSLPEACLVFYH
ncbi:unnamed protein product [Urochloa humidicola]